MTKIRTWTRLSGLTEVLAFSNKPKVGESRPCYDQPEETSRMRLTGEIQDFEDGTSLVVLSGIEYTGYCETCAGEEPIALFYSLT